MVRVTRMPNKEMKTNKNGIQKQIDMFRMKESTSPVRFSSVRLVGHLLSTHTQTHKHFILCQMYNLFKDWKRMCFSFYMFYFSATFSLTFVSVNLG